MTYKNHCKSSTSLILQAYRLVCLQDRALKRSEEFGLKLPVLFRLDIFAIQPNFVTKAIATRLEAFFMSFLLKLLSIVEFFLANRHQIL